MPNSSDIETHCPDLKEVSFLINPVSGGGEGRRLSAYLPEIMASFDLKENQWQSEFTSLEGIQDQIFRLIKCSKKLIAVGGDGTMSDVLTCLANHPKHHVQVGLIPLGTGNDLARVMKIFTNYVNKGLLNTIRKLMSSPSQMFDLWTINNEHTLAAYLSAGIDARVAERFNQDRAAGKLPWKAVWLNKLYYILVFIRERGHHLAQGTLLEYNSVNGQKVRVDLSGKRSIILGNIPSYGGGANPFRESDYNDAQIEVVPVKNIWKFVACMLTSSPLFQRLITNIYIPCHHATQVTLTIPEGESVQVDGEDCTDKFSGKVLEIKHRRKVQLLVLEEV